MNLPLLSITLLSLLITTSSLPEPTARSHFHGNKHPPKPTSKPMSDAVAQGAGVRTSDATLPKTGAPADIPAACGNAKDKDFCIKSLSGNPKSKGMDMRQLALLAIQMAQDKGMEVADFIDGELKKMGEVAEDEEDALGGCSDEYTDALAQMDEAVHGMFGEVPYNEMRSWLSGAMLGATVCGRDMEESGKKGLFPGDGNTVFTKMCDDALSVVITMQADALKSGDAKVLS